MLPITKTPLIPKRASVISILPEIGGVAVGGGGGCVGGIVGTQVTPGVVVSQIGPKVCADTFFVASNKKIDKAIRR